MSKSLWRHTLFLSFLATTYVIVSATLIWHAHDPNRVTWSDAFLSALFNHDRQVLRYILLAAAIAVATSGIARSGLRSCVTLCIALTALVIVDDMYVGPALAKANQRAGHRVTWPLQGDTIIYSSADTLGQIRTGLQLIIDQPAELQAKLGSSWSQNHARARATTAAVALPELFAPFVLIGTLLGALAWMHRHAAFSTPRDETVAKWSVGWVLAPFIWNALTWSDSFSYSIQHHAKPYWWPVVLVAPFIAMALLGWRSTARAK